jgi:translation initiation factor IF-3
VAGKTGLSENEMTCGELYDMAKREGLDLVLMPVEDEKVKEIGSNVFKIFDYLGTLLANREKEKEREKKEKENENEKKDVVKQIKLKPKIQENDRNTKVRRIKEFLDSGIFVEVICESRDPEESNLFLVQLRDELLEDKTIKVNKTIVVNQRRAEIGFMKKPKK